MMRGKGDLNSSTNCATYTAAVALMTRLREFSTTREYLVPVRGTTGLAALVVVDYIGEASGVAGREYQFFKG
jgi:hypothetical protein